MIDRQNDESSGFVALKCPVCNGFGTVSFKRITCHACSGKGYVVINLKDRENEKKQHR